MKRLIATLGKDSSASLSEKTMTILNAPNGSGFKILLSDNIAHYFVRQSRGSTSCKHLADKAITIHKVRSGLEFVFLVFINNRYTHRGLQALGGSCSEKRLLELRKLLQHQQKLSELWAGVCRVLVQM